MLQAENDSNEDGGHDKYKNAETLKRQRRGEFYLKTTLPSQDEFLPSTAFFAFIIFYYQVVNRPNPQKNLTSSNVNKYKNPPLFVSCTFLHPPVLPFDVIHSAILTLS